MSNLKKPTTTDITVLERILNNAHYNTKASMFLKGMKFKGVNSFPQPSVNAEQSRIYMFNNLINLRDKLNELDLGELVEHQHPEVDF